MAMLLMKIRYGWCDVFLFVVVINLLGWPFFFLPRIWFTDSVACQQFSVFCKISVKLVAVGSGRGQGTGRVSSLLILHSIWHSRAKCFDRKLSNDSSVILAIYDLWKPVDSWIPMVKGSSAIHVAPLHKYITFKQQIASFTLRPSPTCVASEAF